MTKIAPDSVVVYEVSINEHPIIVGEDDDRDDEELIEEVEERTSTEGGLEMPEWEVFESDPPYRETFRYTQTNPRINVKMEYEEYDPFSAITDRLEIEGMDMEEVAMSCPGATHIEDFEGDIHLDLTDEEK